jgi:hypothetical protein
MIDNMKRTDFDVLDDNIASAGDLQTLSSAGMRVGQRKTYDEKRATLANIPPALPLPRRVLLLATLRGVVPAL